MRFPKYDNLDEPSAPPPPSLPDEARTRIPPAIRDQMQRQQRETATKVAQTKAALALHWLALDHQADDAAAQGMMAENGEGWRDQSMARFDARAVPLLAALPPDLKAVFAPELAKLRDRHSAASEAQQAARRTIWARAPLRRCGRPAFRALPPIRIIGRPSMPFMQAMPPGCRCPITSAPSWLTTVISAVMRLRR